jgi:starvation-inducible DNA-binding protein
MALTTDNRTTLHSTKYPLSEEKRQEITDILNALTASAIDLRLQAKQAHWNLKGPSFIGLHKLFDKVANDLNESVDDMAERTVQLGGQARGTIQSVQNDTRFEPYDVEATDQMKHVEMLTTNLGAYIGELHQATERVADGIEDPFTEDLLIEIARNLSLRLYFLESHIQG